MKKLFHIIVMFALPVLAGCVRTLGPDAPGQGMALTIKFGDIAQTKTTTVDGEKRFNENVIKSVDFFFYASDAPDNAADAVFHKRLELVEDPVAYVDGEYEATFRLVIKKAEADRIFTSAAGMKATVYAIINYAGALVPGDSLDGTSLDNLAAVCVETNFATEERSYLQDSFLMDGRTVVSFNDSATPNASGVIEAKRFASKMTVAVNVASEVVLKHRSPDEPNEVWTPVLHTMRLYLVDGVKTVNLGVENSSDNANPEFFSYSSSEHKRPFIKDNGDTFFSPTVLGSGDDEKTYYNTYPMYSYPAQWSVDKPDYTAQTLPGQPYFKLEMDWRREERNGYTYDRRKYYYKVFLPFNSLERNNWYHFNVDVSLLGSETDEGMVALTPYCYILDWQNRTVPIEKYAVISKARYLSVDTGPHSLHNIESLSIPFLSSHDVVIVPGSVKATRPFYGEIGEGVNVVGDYVDEYHATIQEAEDGTYYLDYNGQPEGNEEYEPAKWITNTTSSIEFHHVLQNTLNKSGFDYSPYTIEFDIVHDDLTAGVYPYNEYLKHITIVQYPGIYIESRMNSDIGIKKKGANYGYDQGVAPWWDMPWGYVYIDNGRFIRTGNNKTEPYNALTTDNNRKEYQWRTVWYTGGGRDILKINVTVLPKGSEFVIGDPRISGYDTTVPVLGYSFVNDGKGAGDAVLPNRTGNASNFTPAPVVSGDINNPLVKTAETRPLMYYRPTENSNRTEDMLAPAYRISTKLGGTEFGAITMQQAKLRCAGYQEDGFPGGRWRLPTKGEIKFIAQLSEKGVFEFLFNHGGIYWSATGAVTVGSNDVTYSSEDKAFLRCVYDSWYWGDEQWNPRTEFVWGDRP